MTAPARLLVVDDNEDNRYTLTQRLARLGYADIATAVDGSQALDALLAQPFDLVLLDIMMPKLNGYQVLERMKAHDRLRHLPVIMISAVDELDSVVRCIELGAEDYLQKPFNPTLLRARVGACLEKKRLRDEVVAYATRMESELRSAREVQLSMVPTDFPCPTAQAPVEIFAALEPARQVGGDLYDYFWDGGKLYLVIADVSDKGAPASLFMARTKTVVRLVATLLRRAGGTPAPPDELLGRVNRELCHDNPHCMFATLFLGVLDGATGELDFCNAGHVAPYLVSSTGKVRAVDGARGKPAGVTPDARYQTGRCALDVGETLFLYTDGITEAIGRDGAFYTEERLERVLGGLGGAAPADLVGAVVENVREFARGAAQSDDIAALALRRLA